MGHHDIMSMCPGKILEVETLVRFNSVLKGMKKQAIAVNVLVVDAYSFVGIGQVQGSFTVWGQ